MVCFAKYDPLIPASLTSDEVVLLQPVEYNSYFAGACITWRRDANGGAWQPHYRITDHLGSTRLETSSNGTITAAYDYEPFGEQIPLMTTKTRKTYIGKERDEESYLGDFGVRKYDYAAGRFTSPDVLWEKYMSWSPYQYCGNNPISSSDPTGFEIQALDNPSKDNIVLGLDPQERSSVVFNEGGYIDKKTISNGLNSNSSNAYISLTSLVTSDQLITIKTSDNLEYQDINGNKTTFKFSENKGYMGYTCTPTDPDGNYLSINRSAIEVTINPSETKKTQVKYTAHELYLHSLFFILGKPFNHFENDKTTGKQIMNSELNNKVDGVENEAVTNYEKK